MPSAILAALYRRAPAEEVATLVAEAQALDVFEAAATGDGARVGELLAVDASLATAFAEDGFTALHLACFFGHPGAAELLVQAGADVDAIATNGSLLRPLHSAAAARSLPLVSLLLAAGAEVDSEQRGGFTALQAAAQHGDADLVRALLAAGADPSKRPEDGRSARERAHPAVADLLQ